VNGGVVVFFLAGKAYRGYLLEVLTPEAKTPCAIRSMHNGKLSIIKVKVQKERQMKKMRRKK
jgi:hypothetical protein